MENQVKKIIGTYLQGYIHVDYNNLCSVLGNDGLERARESMFNKTKAEWLLEGEVNGEKVIATIYDWNESKGVHYNREWHVGGFDKKALELVEQKFPDFRVIPVD